MDLVFDTLDGHEMEFSTDGARLVRTGTASNIPAAVKSDPLMMLRAFEAVIQRLAPSYPNVIGSRITKINLRPTKGTNQARWAATYEGPPQLPKPQSRWVIEDSSTLASEQTELDLFGDVLLVEWQPPGKQDAVAIPDRVVDGVIQHHSPLPSKDFDPVFHSGALSVLRPRRQISITGWIIGRPGQQALQAMGRVNAQPIFDLPAGYWLCSHVFAKNENAAHTPFPDATMLYHVGATFMSRVDRDWSSYLIYKNKFGQVPKELGTKEEARKRKQILDQAYNLNQTKGNGFLKVGLYFIRDFAQVFGL